MARRGGGHDGGAHGHPARGSGHRHHVLRQGGGAHPGAERRVTVTAKGEYAIKAMLDLALTDDGETLQPIQDIARRQGIPQRYLEQVLLALKRAGFLHSRRGSAGGYRLAKAPEQITVGALLRAVEGRPGVGRSRASSRRGVARGGGGPDLLGAAGAGAVGAGGDRNTVEDLKKHAAERRESAKPMYLI